MSNFIKKKSLLPIKNNARKLECEPCTTCSNCPNGCQTSGSLFEGTQKGRKK